MESSAAATALFHRVAPLTRTNVSFFRTDPYPAALLLRFMYGGGGFRRQCSVSSFDVAKGIEYAWLTALDVPTTEAELRARLARHGAGLHFARLVRTVTPLGPPALFEVTTEAELLIDLDLRDKLERRALCRCGPDAACATCWVLVELVVALLRHWFSDACGFGAPLVVFSGGKGAHIWFASERARRLTLSQRRALGELLARGADCTSALWAPFVERTLLSLWRERGIEARGLWDDVEGASPFGAHVRAVLGVSAAEAAEAAGTTSCARWDALCAHASPAAVRALVWQLAWPAVDPSLLTSKAHTLKAPFSLHHATLCVALPLDEAAVRACDPATMPRLPLQPHDLPLLQRGAAVLEAWLTTVGF